MVVVGIGIDIIDNQRFSSVNYKLAKRLLTEDEYSTLLTKKNEKHQIEFFCGHIAAKEAFVKAIGEGFTNLSFADVEIKYTKLGQPYIFLLKDNAKFTNNTILLSISHSNNTTVAVVIIEKMSLN